MELELLRVCWDFYFHLRLYNRLSVQDSRSLKSLQVPPALSLRALLSIKRANMLFEGDIMILFGYILASPMHTLPLSFQYRIFNLFWFVF